MSSFDLFLLVTLCIVQLWSAVTLRFSRTAVWTVLACLLLVISASVLQPRLIALFIVVSFCVLLHLIYRTHHQQADASQSNLLTNMLDASFDSVVNLPNIAFAAESLKSMTQGSKKLVLIRLQGVRNANRIFGADTTDLLLADIALRLSKAIAKEPCFLPFSAGKVLCALNSVTYLAILDTSQPHNQMRAENILRAAIPRPFAFSEFSQRFDLSLSYHPIPARHDMQTSLHRIRHYYDVNQGVDLDRPQRFALMQVFRRAVENNEIELKVMPQISLQSNEVVAVEILLDWQSANHGVIANRDIIKLAEESGIVYQLTQLEIRQGFAFMASLKESIRVAINLSQSDLINRDLIDYIEACASEYKVPLERLILELSSEGLIHCDSNGLTILHQLANLGVTLSLDNFGQGNASLPQLHHLPFSQIKLDADLLKNRRDDSELVFVNALIELGRRLNKEVVAVGVESGPIHEYVKQKCHSAQGFFYAKPMSPNELQLWLTQRQTS